MARGYVVVGATEGWEWPTRPLVRDRDGIAEQLRAALADVVGDMWDPSDLDRMVGECDLAIAEGKGVWTYGEPYDPHGGTVAWSVAVVELPYV